MDNFSISKLINERDHLLKRLEKVQNAIDVLIELYPEEFHAQRNGDISKVASAKAFVPYKPNVAVTPTVGSGKTWDLEYSFRGRVENLLRRLGTYQKVSTLAKIALPYEKGETEESLQEKISRTLTAFKSEGKKGIEKVKVHAGANGVAWGFADWRDEKGDIKPEHRYTGDEVQTPLFNK